MRASLRNGPHALLRRAGGGAFVLVAATLLISACIRGREAAPAASTAVVGDTHRTAHATPDIPAALAGADTVRVDTVAPGVRHIYAWDPQGPWGIHLLEIDAARCGPIYAARKAGPPQSARARTRELAADALAGINADFFRLPGGTTVEAHVERGRIVAGPGSRPVLALSDGRWWIGRSRVDGRIRRKNGEEIVPIVQVNRTQPGDTVGAVLFTHWYGEASPAVGAEADKTTGATSAAAAHAAATGAASTAGRRTAAAVAISVRQLVDLEQPEDDLGGSGGDIFVGVVADVDTRGGPLSLAPGTVVLRARAGAAAKLRRLAVGDTVTWSADLVPVNAMGPDGVAAADPSTLPVREAVGGNPILLRGGDFAPDIEEGVSPAFGERRHPRTAVGFADGGRRMLWLVVDGRQEPYSAGMSLREVATLLRDLGAEEALNLDGGGSSALVVRGRVVNRPSDATGERPVGNALLLAECRADA